MPCFFRNSMMRITSSSVTSGPCTRINRDDPGATNSISPRPRSCSAPLESRIVRESTFEATRNEIRAGKFALISPVITSTDGRCVARTIWMPTARAICASRVMDSSTSRAAVIIRSASSSMTMTMYGSGSRSSSSASSGVPRPGIGELPDLFVVNLKVSNTPASQLLIPAFHFHHGPPQCVLCDLGLRYDGNEEVRNILESPSSRRFGSIMISFT